MNKESVNVLAVDDKPASLFALESIFADSDIRIVKAESGKDTLRQLLSDEFACVLLDVNLPDIDGFTLAKMIRATQKTQSLPILFVSGYKTDEIDISEGYAMGAVDYLIKPINPSIVRSKVNVFVELHRREIARRRALREKEVLLKEVHHRVKNNLNIICSLLDLQADSISDKGILEVFRESQNRIRSIALIHEKLYGSNNLSGIDMQEYLSDLILSLFKTYGVVHELKINVSDIRLPVDRAIPVSLIISELVSNSLKYAFLDGRGEITISLKRDDKITELTVCDTGIGFPKEIDFRNTKSLGLELVMILVTQLEGEIELTISRVRSLGLQK